MSPQPNVFSLFRPDENTLSLVIADLLDPHGSHGQKTLFLNPLLNCLGLPAVGAQEPVRVRWEVVTSSGRRIDLVIETPALLLGIENKPWAQQRPNQL